MKPVKTIDLIASQTKPTPAPPKKPKKTENEGETMARKTFSVEPRHIVQINAVAAGLTQKTGKPVGSSEALRHMLDKIDGKVSS